ncbi:peptide chain release factor 2 [Tautonia marina]|uniref:peptide chain release factor 2 n=1 Tax=Tautonia marina TaxID=2653855 RepID=UPI0012606991|nr:peptide chain release factor 2 [Tautonia marina]
MDAELKREARSVIDRIVNLRDSLDLADKQARRDELEQEMGQPDFWNDQEQAQTIIGELKTLNGVIKPFEELITQGDDLGAMIELGEEAGDDSFDDELRQATDRALRDFESFELRSMLSGPNDHRNAYVSIHAGAGGTEACDWAEMLMRMYIMWSEAHGYKVEITDREDGGSAGISMATLHITGNLAYGYLKCETGVHRLVRISPFDSQARRQTSFASVDVLPEVDDSIDIEIRDCDLEREVFRCGGPGGQHQNKTESGVRYRHVPTGVTAESRSERSQFKNDANAMALLKSKLIKMEEMKREAEYAKLYDEKGEISFGSQIRNYVLQPYQLVKDLRTGYEVGNPRSVLDGEIDGFIEAYLRMKLEQGETTPAT